MNTGFAAALLDPTRSCPDGLRAWNGSDPAARFAVHRNNVASSLIDALADNLPVVRQLVGETFFRAMAAVYVRRAPPRSPILAHYGIDIADFIADFDPARSVPYLADIARLEMARQHAYHAADAASLARAEMARAMACGEAVGELRFMLHPSVRLLASRHAVVSIWAAHQSDSVDLSNVDVDAAESALILREGLGVRMLRVAPGAVTFIDALRAQSTLADSAAAARSDPAFDLAATLSLLTGYGALAGIRFPEDTTP